MAIVKRVKASKINHFDIEHFSPKRQLMILGTFATVSICSASLGCLLYIYSPLAQESFLKLAGIGL